MPKKTATDDAAQDSATEGMETASTVAMTRHPEMYPAPHAADVHVDEVDNWAKHGWVRAD